MDAVHLTLNELLQVASAPAVYEPLLERASVAAVVVDLASATDVAVDRGVPALPCPVIAVAATPLPAGLSSLFDVVITDADAALVDSDSDQPTISDGGGPAERAVQRVLHGIERNPQAATSLALLLRGSAGRSTATGLLAESATYSTLQSGREFARWLAGHGPRHRRAESGLPVDVQRADGVLRIRLCRPALHNAYNASMRDALHEALLIAVADNSIVRVILSGDGPSFSSGGDLGEFGTTPDVATAHIVRMQRSPATLLDALRDRLEVHLHGMCIGAGIELAAFAGAITATHDAVVALPEVSMGLIPGAGGTVSVTRRIGRHRTAWLALTGMRIGMRTAGAWGLVDEVETELAT